MPQFISLGQATILDDKLSTPTMVGMAAHAAIGAIKLLIPEFNEFGYYREAGELIKAFSSKSATPETALRGIQPLLCSLSNKLYANYQMDLHAKVGYAMSSVSHTLTARRALDLGQALDARVYANVSLAKAHYLRELYACAR